MPDYSKKAPVQTRTLPRDQVAAIVANGDMRSIITMESLLNDMASVVPDSMQVIGQGVNQAITDAATAQAAAEHAQVLANAAQVTADTAIANAAAAQSTATSALNLANTINADYISKTVATAQSVASTFQASAFFVAGLQVVGARQTGWTASTGTAFKAAFNADTTYLASATYTQAETTAAYAALKEARQRIKALEDAMRTHGLIN